MLPASKALPDGVRPHIERLADAGHGFAAIEDGRLVGYLAGIRIPGFKGHATGFLATDFGHAALGDSAARVSTYRKLYSVAAEQWLIADVLTHAITIPANDSAARELFVRLGFGMLVIDAVRPLPGQPIAARCRSEVQIVRAGVADAPLLMPLAAGLADHLRRSPIFLRHEAPTLAEQIDWLRNDGQALWIALEDGEPLGFIQCEPTPSDVAWHVQDSGTVSITGAFVKPECRGSGIADRLLAILLEWATARGYQRCAVDCESANHEGCDFWLRHFEPVCYSYIRRVDDRIVRTEAANA
jgi:GNAT superfamily N-acetyltransferase